MKSLLLALAAWPIKQAVRYGLLGFSGLCLVIIGMTEPKTTVALALALGGYWFLSRADNRPID